MYRHRKSTNQTSIAQILQDDQSDWYILITPYNPAFISVFKAVISWKRRKWDGDRKLWLFAPEYIIQVYFYCKHHFDDVIGDPKVSAVLKEKLEVSQNPYSVLFLTPEAPDWITEKVYKILLSDERSEYKHPDIGGDHEKAAQLTAAMDQIKNRGTSVSKP